MDLDPCINCGKPLCSIEEDDSGVCDECCDYDDRIEVQSR